MSLIAKKKESIPPVEAGTYAAVCVGVVDLGEQYNEKFKSYNQRVLFIFEVPSKTIIVDGKEKPRWLSKEVSPSLNEKSTLFQILTSWRGAKLTPEECKEFDLSKMLGVGCMIQVIVEEKENGSFNKLTSVIGLPEGIPAPESKSELLLFDMDNWKDEAFEKLPLWIQDKIKKSTQYQQEHVVCEKLDFEEQKPAKSGPEF